MPEVDQMVVNNLQEICNNTLQIFQEKKCSYKMIFENTSHAATRLSNFLFLNLLFNFFKCFHLLAVVDFCFGYEQFCAFSILFGTFSRWRVLLKNPGISYNFPNTTHT